MTITTPTEPPQPPRQSFWRLYRRYLALGLWITLWVAMLWNPAHAPVATAWSAIFESASRIGASGSLGFGTNQAWRDFGSALAMLWSDPRVMTLAMLGVTLSAGFSVRLTLIRLHW